MWKSFVFDLHGESDERKARKAGHGNDREWKAWKAMKQASPFPLSLIIPSGFPYFHGHGDDYHVFENRQSPPNPQQSESLWPLGACKPCSGTLSP
jgi:hypothetical protein